MINDINVCITCLCMHLRNNAIAVTFPGLPDVGRVEGERSTQPTPADRVGPLR